MSKVTDSARADTAQVAPFPEPRICAPPSGAQSYVQWLLPSLADMLFMGLLAALSLGIWGPRLLGDADTGWHLRNGAHILATHAVPRVDYFSYTMAGHAWFAWEWLYDALIAAVHAVAGLNGVVVVSAAVIALTFTLLFRFALRSSRNILIAAMLTMLALGAASIHFLARPHLLSWLFAVIWFDALEGYQNGAPRRLYWMPPLMLLWVNLHGGFLLGLALLGIAIAANGWTWATAACPKRRGRAQARARHLTLVAVLCGAATFVTPYGYKLYDHLRGYLGSAYLMDHISEFQAPNFHHLPAKLFAALLVLTVVALALHPGKLRGFSVMAIAFSIVTGLYAARNIPVAAILLVLCIAPLLADSIRAAAGGTDVSLAVRRLATRVEDFDGRMRMLEERRTSHAAAVLLLVIVIGISLNHGRLFSRQVLDLQFDAREMPVKASEYLAGHDIRDHFFSPDKWGGYLIYRLYPSVKLFVDDRHDLYGADFLRDYLKVTQLGAGWRDVLDAQHINWVLMPSDSPLANALRAVPSWRIVYQDSTATIFARAM